ncbi:MAG: hypothetical protein IPK96_11255 [Flammeovirgaceae bacterium]|jgi:ubiquitin C-terminal hydrolase|nr:hypothetical protein [Flammeovirgaceae bacterium]MDZ7649580.1 hypothetical protein [Cytophagales bacterium]
MKQIEQWLKFFERPAEETKKETPEGVCPVCWGHQEYDHRIRKLFKDKQIDVNNHQVNRMIIQDFVVNHLDGIKLRAGEIKQCPTCGKESTSEGKISIDKDK